MALIFYLLASVILGFFIIFVFVVLLFRLLAKFLKKFLKWTFLGWVDKGTGALFGFFKGALIASLFALLVSLVSFSETLQKEQDRSLLFRPVRSVAPAVFNLLKHTFPRTKTFYGELKEGFSNKTQEISNQIISKKMENLQKELEDRVNPK